METPALSWYLEFAPDAFGKPQKAVAAAIPQGFAGREYDNETGLYFNRARYYEPTSARFLSADPDGFAAGDPNLYRYCGNSPTSATDPTGRWALVDDAVALGGGFIAGVVGQGVGDLLGGHFSGWESYVGAGMGGAAAGETLLYTANPILAGMAGGAVGNATTQGLRMASGKQENFDFASLAVATGVGALSSALGSAANSMTAPLGRMVSNGMQSTLAISPMMSCYVTSTLMSGLNGSIVGAGVGGIVGGGQAFMNKGWSGVLEGVAQGAAAGARQGLSHGLVMGMVNPFICFTAGTPVHKADGLKPIETLRPGRRVLTEETKDSGPGDDPTAVDPSTWRLVRLRTAKPAGSDNLVDAELLRSLDWIEAAGAIVGRQIHFELAELGIDGPADVLAIELCPEIESGRGRVITGTFTTARCHYLDLRLVGRDEVLHPSPPHRIFSVDRNDYVPAEDLRPGERLRTRSGQELAVESIRLQAEPERVYNLEVEGEHHYFVGEAGVLVHNGCEEALSTPFDPKHPGRPDPARSIDSREIVNPKDMTANGFPRDNIKGWEIWIRQHPEALSLRNRQLIQGIDPRTGQSQQPVAPTVDPQWVKTFPEHRDFMWEPLILHHSQWVNPANGQIENGPFLQPVPQPIHRGNEGAWHGIP